MIYAATPPKQCTRARARWKFLKIMCPSMEAFMEDYVVCVACYQGPSHVSGQRAALAVALAARARAARLAVRRLAASPGSGFTGKI